MPDLLLAEHAHQVDDWIERGMGAGGQWIALGPSALDRLIELKLDFRLPESLYSPRELGTVCEENHRRLAEVCDLMDARIGELHPDLRRLGMRPFLFHFFELARVTDGLTSRLFRFQRLLQAFPTSKIWVHGAPPDRDSFALTFSPRERIWGAIAHLGTWGSRVEIVPEPAPSSAEHLRADRSTRLRGALERSVGRSVLATTFATSLLARDPGGLAGLARSSRSGTALVVGGACEWRFAVPLLRRSGLRVLFVREEAFRPTGSLRPPALDPSLIVPAEIAGAFTVGGTSFLPMLNDRLRRLTSHGPAMCLAAARRMESLKRVHGLGVLLSAGGTSGSLQGIQQAARGAGLPVLVWQHGIAYANGRICQFFQYLDCMTSDVALTWGMASSQAHNLPSDAGTRFGARILNVGAASLDQLRLRAGRRRNSANRPRRLLYVTTNYYENEWYYGMPPGMSDCALYQDQRNFVGRLSELAENHPLEVIVKLHPSSEHLDPPFLRRLRPSKHVTVVKKQRSFAELLDWADVVLLDFPSTTVLQSIGAGLPVFVLLRHCEHNAEGLRMLTRRAVCGDTADQLFQQIAAFVKDGTYEADLGNTDFLKAYGTYLDDGQSAARAARIVGEALHSAAPSRATSSSIASRDLHS